MPNKRPEVFCISFPRTGTRTIVKALNVLGWDAAHDPLDVRRQLYAGEPVRLRNRNATAHVGSWFLDILSTQFPRARFLYVERDAESWLDSWERALKFQRENGFRNIPGRFALRLACFGRYNYDRDHWRKVYRNHREYVIAMKKTGVPVSFISHDWQSICGALGVPIPDVEYPRVNDKDKIRIQRRRKR